MTGARFLVAVYRALLRAYPARFRDRYGEEMARLFDAERRSLGNARRYRRWRHAAGALADLVKGAGAEQIASVVERLRAREPPGEVARRSERRGRSMDEVIRDVRDRKSVV